MPRTKSGMEPPTPLAEVLTDYMAKQRPLWTTGRLARALGERRQTVGNWLYHDITPPIEKMFAILAQLNIPISELLDAYRRAGVPTPALSYETPAVPGDATGEATGARQKEREAEAEAQRWRRMIENTREVMLATGFPAAALDTLIASLEASHTGHGALDRHVAAEMAGPPPVAAPAETAKDNDQDQEGETSRTSPKSRPR